MPLLPVRRRGIPSDASVPERSQRQPVTPGFARADMGRTAPVARMIVQLARQGPCRLPGADTGRFKDRHDTPKRRIACVDVLLAARFRKTPAGRVLP